MSSSDSSVPSSPVSTSSTLITSNTSPSLENLTLKDVSDKDREFAAKVKAEANAAFLQAIEHNPTDATIFCGRAYARMKLEELGYAIGDCSKAIELDPKYVKAYNRRAICHLQTLRPQLAVADFKNALKLDPKNATVKTQLETTQKLIRKAEFEKMK